MIGRIAIWTAVFLTAVVITAAAIAAYGLRTDGGRRALANLLEARMSGALAADVALAVGDGDWPESVDIESLRIERDGSPVLIIGQARLRWAPLALLRGRIEIVELSARHVGVLGSVAAPSADDAQDESRAPLRLPRIPALVVERLDIQSLLVSEDVAGRTIELSLNGEADLFHESGFARLRAAAPDAADFASVEFRYGAGEEMGGEVHVASDGGLIARELRASGPAYLDVSWRLAAEDLTGVVEGRVGDLIAFESAIVGGGGDGVRLEGSATLGDDGPQALRERVGDTIEYAVNIAFDDDAAFVGVDRIASDAGSLSGAVTAAFERRSPIGLTLDLEVLPAPSVGGDLRRLLDFDAATLTATADRLANDAWAMSAALDAGRLTARTADARWSPADGAVTDLELSLTPAEEIEALTDRGVTLSGTLAYNGTRIEARDLAGAFDDEAATLEGTVVFDAGEIDARLAGAVRPELAALIAPEVRLAGPARIRLKAGGGAQTLSADLRLDVPRARAGDIEIAAGETTATLSGGIASPVVVVSGRALDGSWSGEGRFERKGEATFDVGGLIFQSGPFRLDGSGSYVRGGRSSVNLQFSAPRPFRLPGGPSVGGSGRLDALMSDDGIVDAMLALDALSFEDRRIESASAEAKGRLADLAVRIDMKRAVIGIPIEYLSAAATLDAETFHRVRLTEFEALLASDLVKLTRPATLRLDAPGPRTDGLAFSVNRTGSLVLKGGVREGETTLTAAARNLDIPGLAALLDADIALDTTAARPGSAKLSAASQNSDLPQAIITANVDWDGQIVRSDARIESGGRGSQVFSATLPLTLDGADGSRATVGALSSDLDFAGPLEWLTAFAPPSPHRVAGDLSVAGTVAGPLETLVADIDFTVSEGRYENDDVGVLLTRIDGAGTVNGAPTDLTVDIEAEASGASESASKTISARAAVDMNGGGSIDAALSLKKALVVSSSELVARVSGDISVSGPLAEPAISGDLSIDRLDAEIPKSLPSSVTPLEVVSEEEYAETIDGVERSEGSPLAVAVTARDAVYVRGRGLDTQWRADVAVGGTTASPRLSGDLQIVRGSLEFAGRRFRITRGDIVFTELNGADPTLDIAAEYETPDGVIAIIEVTGSASDPSIDLSSNPSLPDEDVMALILFGRPANEIGAAESLRLAYTLAQLSAVGPLGGAGFDAKIRRAVGLDVLSLETGESVSESSLEVGKYVADGVYVGAEQSLNGENAALNIEIELTRRISLETELRQSGGQRASINWKRDF